MIELRWVLAEECLPNRLQQRTKTPVVDASGAFCGWGEWSAWTDVPLVPDDNETSQ